VLSLTLTLITDDLGFLFSPGGPEDINYLLLVEEVRKSDFPKDEKREILGREYLDALNPWMLEPSIMPPGIGWSLEAVAASFNCDGTYDSFCHREASNDCLLYGHNDFRGGILFDGLSGWVVMNLELVERGVIVVKMEDWHKPETNARTAGWTCENNDCGGRNLRIANQSANSATNSSVVRKLGDDDGGDSGDDGSGKFCDDFEFQFAINGKVTKWKEATYREKKIEIARVHHQWTLLDDPKFVADGPQENVEVAIRLTGCARQTVFKLTHIYWQ